MSATPPPPTLLFVYGSLRRDAAGRHHPLLVEAEFAGAATVRGRLYRVSWHPGLVVDPDGPPAHGELFRIPPGRHDAIFAALNTYEGPAFLLTPVEAKTGEGRLVAAVTYAWLGDTGLATLLPAGDFGVPGPHQAP